MRALAMLLALSFCAPDETVSGYADPDARYLLERLDGGPPPARLELRLPGPGRAEGSGPCNAFSAEQRAPYPWFELGPIAATRRGCPELEAEAELFAALGEMGLAEVAGPVLILSNTEGREMLFRAQP